MKYLVLSDIGPFRGRHIFDFSSDEARSGFAFFAKNGRGKTSIYNAMKWALFGKVRRKSKLVNDKVIEGALKPIVDEQDYDNMLMNYNAWQDDTPQSMSVLFVAEGEFGEIQVQRTASCNGMARSDKQMDISLSVSLNGKVFQETEAEEEIGKVFPIELERFFFIDGEEVETYTTMMKSSSQGIIDDIKSILRLPSLTRGIEDLRSIKKTYTEAIDADNKQQQRDLKQGDKARTLHGQLMMIRKQISETEAEILRLKDRRDEFDEKIRAVEELKTYADEKMRVDAKIEVLGPTMKSNLETFIDDFSNASNILMWGKIKLLYEKTSKANDNLQNQSFEMDRLESEIRKITKTIVEFQSICDKCHQEVPNAEEFILEREDEVKALQVKRQKLNDASGADPIGLRAKLSAFESFQPNHGALERLQRSYISQRGLVSQLSDLKEKQSNLSDHVSDDSAKEITELAQKAARTDQALLKKEEQLRSFKFKEDELDSNYKTARPNTSDSNKIDSIYELRDMISRFVVAINDTVKSYSDKATEEVQQEASKVFLQLSNSPASFSGIRLTKQFKARIYGSDGRPVVGASSGMEVIMTLSIIDALRTVSRLDAPVFFDTPARSLDKDHKNGMLRYFWREDRSQFLIFAHSGEFTVDEIVNEEVAVFSKAWELLWPEDLEETCIHCWSKNVEHASKHERKCTECGEITDSRSRNTKGREVVIHE